MTTIDNPTDGVDVYTALERLPKVRTSVHMTAMTDRIRQLRADIAGTISEAKEMCAMHEAQSKIVVDDLEAALASDAHEVYGLSDGLYEVMSILSGHGELFTELQLLSDLCNPDHITAPAD